VALPYMPLYVGDYLRDTARLSATQHGAYLLLLMDMWNHDGLLPDQPSIMAAIARVDPKSWPKVWRKIEPLFYKVDGGWRQKRLQNEVEKAASKSAKRAAAGALGGERKALKTRGTRKAIATHAAGNSQANATEVSGKRGSMPEPEPELASRASKPRAGEASSGSVYLNVREALGPSVLDPDNCGLEAAVNSWLNLGADEALIVTTVRTVTAFERERPIRKLHAITPEIRKSMDAQNSGADFQELSPAQSQPIAFPEGSAGDALRAIVAAKGAKWAQAWMANVSWNGTDVYARSEHERLRIDQEVGHILSDHGYERVVVGRA
jgi:uncharacterized protein YdaU (DUF1376 family)